MTPRMRSGQQPSGKSDWETPDDLMAVLREEFGEFDLDPCATQDTKKAAFWYGPDSPLEYDCKPDGGYPKAKDMRKATDGLAIGWMHKVYVNPPYGRGIAAWVGKCARETWWDGNAELVVALLPVATDTHWWLTWIGGYATEVRFLKGRVHFKGAAGPAPFASAIVVWRRGMLGWHRVSYWDWKAKL